MDVRRRHAIPFGSVIEDDGHMAFHPWAPQAQRVEPCLVESTDDTCLDMNHQGSGWYGLVMHQATASRRKRLRHRHRDGTEPHGRRSFAPAESTLISVCTGRAHTLLNDLLVRCMTL